MTKKTRIQNILCILLVLIYAFSLSALALPEVGDAPLDPVFSLNVTTDKESYYAGQTVTVSVTVSNIIPAKGLSFVSFKLWYDKTKAEPVIKNDGNLNENFSAMLAVSPDSTKWECFGKLCDGYYELSALTDSNATAKDDGSIRIDVQFKLLRGEYEDVSFVVPNDSIQAYDFDMRGVLYGTGGTCKAAVEQAVFEVVEGKPAVIDGGYIYVKEQNAKIKDLRAYFTCDVEVTKSTGAAVKETDAIATNQIVTALGNRYTVVLYGDVNGDGKISVADYTIVKRVLQNTLTIEGAFEKAAHVSMRDSIRVSDYTRIKRYIQGISALLP